MVAAPNAALAQSASPDDVLRQWYRLSLALVRHTPTYSPPVASRALAYLGVTAYEAVASGSSRLQSLAGQLNGLEPMPPRVAGAAYDEAIVLDAALAAIVQNLFANTGPSGQQAMDRLAKAIDEEICAGKPAEVIARSKDYGEAIAAHISAWSRDDGGAVVENLGFPDGYTLTDGPSHWTPTNATSRLQQSPLLPGFGKNRPFAMPAGRSCPVAMPLAYSEDKTSNFYKQALEAYDTAKALTPEQRAIANFWSDEAMLSPTPAGSLDLDRAANRQPRSSFTSTERPTSSSGLSVAMADAFIGCWDAKYHIRSRAARHLHQPRHRSRLAAAVC